MDRREVIKNLSALPFAGAMMNPFEGGTLMNPYESSAFQRGANAAQAQNIFQKIGVEPIINCRGTFTMIGGSIERPEVTEAKVASSKFFVQVDELAFAVGQRLADLTGAEWGMVPCGCAAGLKHVTAACVTGGNPERLVRIPDLTGFEKTEVIIPRRSHNTYNAAIRNIGVTIILVDTPEELQSAINSRTAMICTTSSGENADAPFSMEQLARMAKPRNIPILIDVAAEDLTVPNVHLARGATVVAYSGGKAICGPQNAGLLLGNKDILLSAWQASSPHHGPGRDNKVAKTEVMGMLAAVEAWIARDHAAKEREWMTWFDNIGKRVSAINGVTYTVTEPRGLDNRSARLSITWNPDVLNIYGTDVAEEVATTAPRIALGGTYIDNNGMTGLSLGGSQLQPGQDKIVADRLYAILSRKNEKSRAGYDAPQANIAGRWNVDIEFFSSKGRHAFFLEQDGNLVAGSHQGKFTTREINGVVDGNKVILSSRESQNAMSVPFTFHGTIVDGRIEGGIFMGEYLTAKGFTATRTRRQQNQNARPGNQNPGPIRTPSGRPPFSS